ncbi:hypothetical protein [Algibacter sp. 2305UL17-15]|uniref:hypothetical protein n=1 Tax=Algibacter sp. 2305UL17-15 TaxID=3231268 RepID=UPI00345806B0
MDGLDLLKKDWKKDDKDYPKLSYDELYKMILKKSSSIVKWIFIISLLEFVFWFGISFLLKGTSFSGKMEALDLNAILIPISIVSYIVIFYFFYLFYKNYKNISATDNSKTLMENILKTRRTVKYYVIFNLAMIVLGAILGTYYAINHDPELITKIQQASANGNTFAVYAGIMAAIILVLAIAIGALILFYWLIYGLLLRRLNRNYIELKRLEV